MKLLILAFAFAFAFAFGGHANAQNDKAITFADGSTASIKEYSTELVARSFGVLSEGGSREYLVYNCNKGYGKMEVFQPYEDDGYRRRHVGTVDWAKGGTSSGSSIATYTCDTAIKKAIK